MSDRSLYVQSIAVFDGYVNGLSVLYCSNIQNGLTRSLSNLRSCNRTPRAVLRRHFPNYTGKNASKSVIKIKAYIGTDSGKLLCFILMILWYLNYYSVDEVYLSFREEPGQESPKPARVYEEFDESPRNERCVRIVPSGSKWSLPTLMGNWCDFMYVCM
jgi:hypothetical protein